MTIQELRKYYQGSWFAWFFLPFKLKTFLDPDLVGHKVTKFSLTIDKNICVEFETFSKQTGFFRRWLFRDIITAFTEGETYKKYLLVPERERQKENKDDDFFPLLQSISGYDRAQKTYEVISQLSNDNCSIKKAIYNYGLLCSGVGKISGCPELSLDLDNASNLRSVTLDFTNKRESDIKEVFPDVIKLLASNNCPHNMMLQFSHTLTNALSEELYQVLQHDKRPGVCIMVGTEVLSMNQKNKEEMLEAKELMEIMRQPVFSPSPFFNANSPNLMDRLYSAVLQGQMPAVKHFVTQASELKAAARLTKTTVDRLAEEAIQHGHLKIVEYLTTLDGDLKLSQDEVASLFHSSATDTQHSKITQYFVNLSGDNKLNTEHINKTLLRSIHSYCLGRNRWSSIPILVAMEGDNKPDSDVISCVLQQAVNYKKWDIVTLIFNIKGDNKPNEESMKVALSEATKAGKLDEVMPHSSSSDSQHVTL